MFLVVFAIFLASMPFLQLLSRKDKQPRALKDIGFAVTIICVTLTLFPRTVYKFGTAGEFYADIAPSVVTIWAYQIALLVAMSILWKHAKPSFPLPFMLGSILIPGWMLLWGINSAVLSGYFQILTAMLAWVVGSQLAQCINRDRQEALLVARIIFMALLIQLLIVLVQQLGVVLPSLLTAASHAVVERPVGTLGNAAVLSKVPVFLLFFCLPLSSSANKKTQFWATASIIVGLLLAGITVSRANTFAMVAAILIWILSSRISFSFGRRLFVILSVGVATILLLDRFLARFKPDDGDSRDYLNEVAFRVIPDNIWTGIGVNSYVERVSQLDSFTARTGFPVHNAILLLLIEFGIPLFILLMVPIATVFISAFLPASKNGSMFVHKAAARALLPGLLVISLTGWGIAGSSSLVLFALCLGFNSNNQRIDREEKAEDEHLSEHEVL